VTEEFWRNGREVLADVYLGDVGVVADIRDVYVLVDRNLDAFFILKLPLICDQEEFCENLMVRKLHSRNKICPKELE